MKLQDVLNELEDGLGKVYNVYLKDGQTLKTRIVHGTNVDDQATVFLVISEGKSTMDVRLSDIERIEPY